MRNARKTGFAEMNGEPWGDSADGLPLALVRARECVMAHFRNLLRRYNLTEPQWRVLKTMEEIATVELSELSRRTALLMPSLSRIVRELELRGYMQKAADQRDLRRILATLTARGRLLVEAVSPECDAVHVAIRKAMGGDKILKLHDLLGELERRIAPLDVRRTDSEAVDAGLKPLAPAKQRGRPRKSAPAA
jgi:homoprotocatechuate degradation regulator HpaR